MKKLTAVEDARAVMNEGMNWGVWKWLTEKKRVRGLADDARAALDDLEMKVKATWPDEYKLAYNQLVSEDGDSKSSRKHGKRTNAEAGAKGDAKVMATVKKIKEADDDAYNAHEDAEEQFTDAERKMSTSGAREGARMALVAYDTHEAAIRKAEALGKK